MRFSLRRIKAIAKDSRGAEIAELATVLPLLIVILLGIMWFGRAFNIYTTLNRAAREAAQAATLHTCASCGNAPAADIRNSVVNPILSAAHIDPNLVQNFQMVDVIMNPSSAPQIHGKEVSMEYPYTFTLRGVTCCPPRVVPIKSGITIHAKSRAQGEE